MRPVEHPRASHSVSVSQVMNDTELVLSPALSQLLGWAYEGVNSPVLITVASSGKDGISACQLVFQNAAAYSLFKDGSRVEGIRLSFDGDKLDVEPSAHWYSLLLSKLITATPCDKSLDVHSFICIQSASGSNAWMKVSVKSMCTTGLPAGFELESGCRLFVMTLSAADTLMDSHTSCYEEEDVSTPSAQTESSSSMKPFHLPFPPHFNIQHSSPVNSSKPSMSLASKDAASAPTLFSDASLCSVPPIDTRVHRMEYHAERSLPAAFALLSPRSPYAVHPPASRYETEFEELQCLGKGGFGAVYRARNKLDGQEYAIKKVRLRCSASDLNAALHSFSPSPLSGPSAIGRCDERIIREVKTFAQISTHSNVVRYYNAWIEPLRYSSTPSRSKMESDCSYSVSSSEAHSSHIDTLSGFHDPLHFDMDGVDLNTASIEYSEDKRQNSTDSIGLHMSPTRYPLADSPKKTCTPRHQRSSSLSKKRAASLSTPYPTYSSVLYIQMQLCPMTDLRRWMDNRRGQMDRMANMEILTQILLGLHHVHSQGIIHRDLKPENIFVDENRVLLGDFGLAKNVGELSHNDASPVGSLSDVSHTAYVNTSTHQGTYLYTAPEILSSNICTTNSDIYSFGVIMIELFTSFSTGMERAIVLRSIKSQTLEKVKESLGDEMMEEFLVIASCLESDPAKRPTAIELLESEFFNILRHSQGTSYLSFNSSERASLVTGASAPVASSFGIEYRRRASIASEIMNWNDRKEVNVASPYREHRGSASSYSRRSSRQDCISRRSSNSSALQHSILSASNSTPIEQVYGASERGSDSTIETVGQDETSQERMKLLEDEMEKLKAQLEDSREREKKLSDLLAAAKSVPEPVLFPSRIATSNPTHPLLQRTWSNSSASSSPPSVSANNSMARLFLTPVLCPSDKLDFRKQAPKSLHSPPTMSPSMSTSSTSSRRLSALSLSFEQYSKKENVSPKASAPTLSPSISTSSTCHAIATGTMIVTENLVNVLTVHSPITRLKPITIPKKT